MQLSRIVGEIGTKIVAKIVLGFYSIIDTF